MDNNDTSTKRKEPRPDSDTPQKGDKRKQRKTLAEKDLDPPEEGQITNNFRIEDMEIIDESLPAGNNPTQDSTEALNLHPSNSDDILTFPKGPDEPLDSISLAEDDDNRRINVSEAAHPPKFKKSTQNQAKAATLKTGDQRAPPSKPRKYFFEYQRSGWKSLENDDTRDKLIANAWANLNTKQRQIWEKRATNEEQEYEIVSTPVAPEGAQGN